MERMKRIGLRRGPSFPCNLPVYFSQSAAARGSQACCAVRTAVKQAAASLPHAEPAFAYRHAFHIVTHDDLTPPESPLKLTRTGNGKNLHYGIGSL